MRSPSAAAPVPVTVAALRDAHSVHAKSVCLVSVRRGNEAVGMTIDSFVSISLDPPLVGFFVGEERTILSTLLEAEEIAVNILANDQEPLARRLATSGSDIVRHGELAGDLSEPGAPTVRGALAAFIGHVRDATAIGDHVLVVLQVKRTMVRSDEPELETPTSSPLLFYRSSFSGLPGSAPDQLGTRGDL